MPTFREALVILKRAETQKKSNIAPDKRAQDSITKAIEVVGRNKKYVVDPATYAVAFAHSDQKIQVTSIEDFILFVESVESEYPSASPRAVAAEIRQVWYADANWEMLIDSDGIMNGDKAVDIESAPSPIASRFDMSDLEARGHGKQISTPLGTVDIGHVMAGIDAALSGGPQAYPQQRLQRSRHDDGKSRFKYDKLKELSAGDPRDFATWAGDLGQAYAVYISDVYVDQKPGHLNEYVSEYAKPAELLGDVHGFIAGQVAKDLSASRDPAGTTLKVSEILRDLYLVQQQRTGGDSDTYRAKFEQIIGKQRDELRQHLITRAQAFAEPWYVKQVIDNNPLAGLNGYDDVAQDFWAQSERNEGTADPDDTLAGLVDSFLEQLKGQFR